MRSRAILASALALPGVAIMVLLAASDLTALITGQPIIWRARVETLSEAVSNRDRAEVIRQILAGADVDAPYDTYDVFRAGEHLTVTPHPIQSPLHAARSNHIKTR